MVQQALLGKRTKYTLGKIGGRTVGAGWRYRCPPASGAIVNVAGLIASRCVEHGDREQQCGEGGGFRPGTACRKVKGLGLFGVFGVCLLAWVVSLVR